MAMPPCLDRSDARIGKVSRCVMSQEQMLQLARHQAGGDPIP